MPICAADMRSCDKKAKCIFGPNEGKAYNPANPCCGSGTFNKETCDCGYGYGSGWEIIQAYWNVWQQGTGTLSDYTGWREANLSNGPMQNSIPIGEGRYGYIDWAFFASSKACAGPDSEVGSSGTFNYRIIASKNGVEPGEEDDIVRSLCVWPTYCGVQRYTGPGTGETGCITYTTSGYIVGARTEIDEETNTEIQVFYSLFNNLDPNGPYHQDKTFNGVAIQNLPTASANTSSVFNGACACLDLS